MIDIDAKVKFILEELYNKTCNCRRDYPELDDLLNPTFHLEECPYRVLVEQQDIEWKQE